MTSISSLPAQVFTPASATDRRHVHQTVIDIMNLLEHASTSQTGARRSIWSETGKKFGDFSTFVCTPDILNNKIYQAVHSNRDDEGGGEEKNPSVV